MRELDQCSLKRNQVAVVWLGQAGFIFKTEGGDKVAVDPYLSHCGEMGGQFIRLSPILIEPEKLEVDAILVTHKHFDHFDYDAIPEIAEKTQARFFGPCSCVEEFEKMGLCNKRMELLQKGELARRISENIWVKAVYADHGELEPAAIGLVLQIGNVRIYITGDTAFRPDRMEEVRGIQPDIMVASINGEFGNLDPYSGAELAVYTDAGVLIPCHFWTFREHKGRPDLLADAIREKGCGTKLQFLTPGEVYLCEKILGGEIKIERQDPARVGERRRKFNEEVVL